MTPFLRQVSVQLNQTDQQDSEEDREVIVKAGGSQDRFPASTASPPEGSGLEILTEGGPPLSTTSYPGQNRAEEDKKAIGVRPDSRTNPGEAQGEGSKEHTSAANKVLGEDGDQLPSNHFLPLLPTREGTDFVETTTEPEVEATEPKKGVGHDGDASKSNGNSHDDVDGEGRRFQDEGQKGSDGDWSGNRNEDDQDFPSKIPSYQDQNGDDWRALAEREHELLPNPRHRVGLDQNADDKGYDDGYELLDRRPIVSVAEEDDQKSTAPPGENIGDEKTVTAPYKEVGEGVTVPVQEMDSEVAATIDA